MEPLFEIKEEKKGDNYSTFVISPLVAGYGSTIGTALRRVLLSSLPGAAIVRVKVAGAKHQFSTLKGMREDVLDFLMNIKRVNFVYDGEKPVKVSLNVKGPGEVKAGDIKVPSGVEVANPELVLANLSKDGKIDAEMEVERGTGYSLAEERKEELAVGVIPMDASFSPVERVNFRIEETRVGRVTNYDKLNLEVWTNGTIKPKDAVTSGAKILLSYFEQIVNPKKVVTETKKEAKDDIGPVGKLSVEEIGLPTRVANALSKAGYETVEKLVRASYGDLMKVRNLGEKSIKIVDIALKEKGVSLKNA